MFDDLKHTKPLERLFLWNFLAIASFNKKTMKILFCFTVFYLICFTSVAQDSLALNVFFVNNKTKEVIPNVEIVIFVKNENFRFISNIKGECRGKLPLADSYQINASHPLFQSKVVQLKRDNRLNINLSQSMIPLGIQEIDPITVKAPGVPDTIFGSVEYSVADYVLLPDNQILLLLYTKNLKKGTELALFSNNEIKKRFFLPESATSLIEDYRGVPHALCENSIYSIFVKENTIQIAKTQKEYFKNYIEPIIDTNTSKLYFSNFNKDYPAFKYFSFDQVDSVYKQIMEVQDDLMMELYRAEYKWVDVRTKLWAKEREQETGIDAEIWVGATVFTQSIYYKQLYAPFFKVGDSLYIFDYYKDKLLVYNEQGELGKSIPIIHHYEPKTTGWKKKLIQNKSTKEIFAYYLKDGYSFVGKVDLSNGKIDQKTQLKFKYIENIKIDGPFVYYIYRPFESSQKKFLYRERLP